MNEKEKSILDYLKNEASEEFLIEIETYLQAIKIRKSIKKFLPSKIIYENEVKIKMEETIKNFLPSKIIYDSFHNNITFKSHLTNGISLTEAYQNEVNDVNYLKIENIIKNNKIKISKTGKELRRERRKFNK